MDEMIMQQWQTDFGIAMAEIEFAGLKFKGGKIFVFLQHLVPH